MSNDDYPVIFADGLLDVSHANGVFRISFGEQEGEGKVKLVGKILIPGNQIGPVMQQISSAVNDIANRMQKKPAPASSAAKAPARSTAKTTASKVKARQARSQAVKKKAPASAANKTTVRRKKTTK